MISPINPTRTANLPRRAQIAQYASLIRGLLIPVRFFGKTRTVSLSSSFLGAQMEVTWRRFKQTVIAASFWIRGRIYSYYSKQYRTSGVVALLSCAAAINSISWAPHSNVHLCTGSDDHSVKIWDLSSLPYPISGTQSCLKVNPTQMLRWNTEPSPPLTRCLGRPAIRIGLGPPLVLPSRS